MFDVGFSELLVIGLVALIVIGPKRLPEVARAAGRWAGRLQRFVTNVKQDFDRELRQAELSELRQLKQELDDTRRVMEDTSSRLMQDVQAIPADANPAAANTIAPPAAPAHKPVVKQKTKPRRHGRRKKTRRPRR